MLRSPMKRRYRDTGPDPDTVELVLKRAGYSCESCDDGLYGKRGQGWHVHHRRPRKMGGTRWDGINLPSNLLVLCAFCHADVESRRQHALDVGRLLLSFEDPPMVRVLVAQHWVYLTDDGGYERPDGVA